MTKRRPDNEMRRKIQELEQRLKTPDAIKTQSGRLITTVRIEMLKWVLHEQSMFDDEGKPTR